MKNKKIAIISISIITAVIAIIVVAVIVVGPLFVKSSHETKPWEYVSCNDSILIAVNNDGTVSWKGFAYGDDTSTYVKYDLSDWQDIKSVASSHYYVAGLKNDGTVTVNTAYNAYKADRYDSDDSVDVTNDWIKNETYIKIKEDVKSWDDIVSISAGRECLVGLKADDYAVLMSDGTLWHGDVYATEIDSWTDIKTGETSNKNSAKSTTLLNTKNTSGQANKSTEKTTIANYTTTATTSKETTVTNSSKQSFYEDKYYLFADERGQLNVFVFQLYEDNVKVTVYDNIEGYSTPTYVDRYPLEWNDEYTYAENDLGMEFVIDYNLMIVKYKDSDMEKLQALSEYDDLSKSDLEDFASDYS